MSFGYLQDWKTAHASLYLNMLQFISIKIPKRN